MMVDVYMVKTGLLLSCLLLLVKLAFKRYQLPSFATIVVRRRNYRFEGVVPEMNKETRFLDMARNCHQLHG
jgi:hypothetical protein